MLKFSKSSKGKSDYDIIISNNLNREGDLNAGIR